MGGLSRAGKCEYSKPAAQTVDSIASECQLKGMSVYGKTNLYPDLPRQAPFVAPKLLK